MTRRNNGEGTVTYNAERKRWEGRVTLGFDADGKQLRKKVTGRTKGECVARLKEAQRSVDVGLPVTDRSSTVGAFLAEWLDHIAHTDRSSATVETYRDIVRTYIAPRIGRVKLADLKPAHVERLQRDILKDGKSARTARASRSVLRAALRHAERHGLVQRNAAALSEPVKQEHTEKRSMTPQQIKKLFATVEGTRDEAAVVLLCTGGMRRAELLGLQWSDVDLNKGTVRIVRALKRTPNGLELDDVKTAKSRRTLIVPPITVETLRRHKARQNEDRMRAGEHWTGGNFVIATAWGSPIDLDNLTHRFIAACEAAKIGKWTPHDARHSVGSLMIDSGADLRDVSEYLGHSSIRVTADIYLHRLPGRNSEAAAAFARALA